VAGGFNHNGNDGTISRFGWKAQNKSLDDLSGEAYTRRWVSPTNSSSRTARGRRNGNGGTGQTDFRRAA